MSFDFPHAGETYSLLSALVWAVAVILFRKSGDLVPPRALNVFKNTFALGLVALTMLALGTTFLPAERTASDWLHLLLSGALGLGIADSLVFAGLNRIGASRFAIVDCSFTPWIFLCSSLYLHEDLGWLKLAAGALVGGAVLVGTLERTDTKPIPRATLVAGTALGLTAMLVVALGVVVAKPVLDIPSVDPWWAIGVRLVGGVFTSGVVAVVSDREALVRTFVPSRTWRFTVPAAFVGTYMSMCLWILGIKFTRVTTSSVLNQTCTIFTLILATIFLGEALTVRRVIAILLGSCGAVLVSLEKVLEGTR
ncbi:MAG TPA: DMT family transporter [Planctomycetota bacterium]|nr:DMT family transporter [Planctomycetota bacterium]